MADRRRGSELAFCAKMGSSVGVKGYQILIYNEVIRMTNLLRQSITPPSELVSNSSQAETSGDSPMESKIRGFAAKVLWRAVQRLEGWRPGDELAGGTLTAICHPEEREEVLVLLKKEDRARL